MRYLERTMAVPDGCKLWEGNVSPQGYGKIKDRGPHRDRPAHVVIYEQEVGPIPEGLEIDHLCMQKLCGNPDHLEAVPHRENCRRWGASITHCPHGHEYTEENTYRQGNSRSCRMCRNRPYLRTDYGNYGGR